MDKRLSTIEYKKAYKHPTAIDPRCKLRWCNQTETSQLKIKIYLIHTVLFYTQLNMRESCSDVHQEKLHWDVNVVIICTEV